MLQQQTEERHVLVGESARIRHVRQMIEKVVLITGASSGIGAGIAEELGRAGAKLMLGARRTDRARHLVRQRPRQRFTSSDVVYERALS